MLTTAEAAGSGSASPDIEDDGTSPGPDPGAWRRLSLANLAVILLAFLLPVVWSSSVYNWFFTPKSALALVALGPGLVVLAWLAARRDGPALAAAAFLAAAAVSTAFAHEPLMSLLGEYFTQNGLLLTAACVSLWALGRTIGDEARPFLVLALLGSALVNAAVGWLQMSTDLGIEALAPFQDRATGLMSNPVQLGGLCVAALWLAAARERSSERPLVWWTTVIFLSGAVELSGSRIATVLAIGVVIVFAVAHLRRRQRGRAGALVAAGVVGVVLAMAVGSPSGASGRAGAGSSGLGTRVEIWKGALGALEDRPLIGFGPGRYVSVSSPRRTLEVASYEGPDVLYSDAHNLFVEYAVSTGLIGIALLGTWLVLSGRRSRGPLAGFCVLGVLVGLLQPQFIGLTALLALALGGAMSGAPPPRLADFPRTVGRVAIGAGAVLALAGMLAGSALVFGDTHYARAVARRSVAELDAAAAWLPPWPQIPAFRSNLELVPGTRTNGHAVALQREVIDRDSQDPSSWYTLGSLLFKRGEMKGAGAAYGEALMRNPWSFFGLAGSYQVALQQHDLARARIWRAKLCRLGVSYCPPRSDLDPDARASSER